MNSSKPTVSIVIPVYNEQKTVKKIVQLVVKYLKKIKKIQYQIVVINDGSTDLSKQEINSLKLKNLVKIHLKVNRGKGYAVRKGIKKSDGDIIIIQDADLEYHPKYYQAILEPIFKKETQVVYGSRLAHLPLSFKTLGSIKLPIHFIANKVLSKFTSILYNAPISDMETCYKAFTRKAIKSICLETNGFEFETEITAKLLKSGYNITEVGITTKPRDYSEGKKIGYLDGFKAVYYLLKYKFE